MGRYRRKQKASTPVKSNRHPKRKQWDEVSMQAAIRAAQDGLCSINQAARDHGIPCTTLKDRISGRVVHGTKPGPVPYLTKEEEDELEKYLLDAAKCGFGKTRKQVKAIVEKIAIKRGTLRSEHVSDGWWKRFLQRHPNLSLRQGDATGHVRMNAVTKDNIKHYFSLLKKILEENDFFNHPERVYNMDETGIPFDPREEVVPFNPDAILVSFVPDSTPIEEDQAPTEKHQPEVDVTPNC